MREAGEDTEGARREAQDLEEAQQASRIRETTERNATIQCKLLEDGSAENARNWGRVTARPRVGQHCRLQPGERTVGTVALAAPGRERGERTSEAESAGPPDGPKKRTRKGGLKDDAQVPA